MATRERPGSRPPAKARAAPTEREVDWLASPEHTSAAAVAGATRLDFDQVAGHATMRSPVFLASAAETTISATLLFDAHLGCLLAVDLMGPAVGRYNRLVDPLETSRPALWRRREPGRHAEAEAEAETVLCEVPHSLLIRHRDVGLPLVLRGARSEIGLGLPAHLLQGFLSRVEPGLPTEGVGDGGPGAGGSGSGRRGLAARCRRG